MASQIFINIDSGNGLLPDGTKPLPQPKLTIIYEVFHIIINAPLFRRGADHVYESPLGDLCLVMNIHNPFMHCATSQYVFKLRDVIMLTRAVTIVAA